MADPLGLISGGGGLGGLNRLGAGGLTPRSSGVEDACTSDPSQPSFKDVLMNNLEQANQLQGEAAAAQEDFASGKRGDVENVLLATQKADQAFHMLLALKNKVQQAYEEVKQVKI